MQFALQEKQLWPRSCFCLVAQFKMQVQWRPELIRERQHQIGWRLRKQGLWYLPFSYLFNSYFFCLSLFRGISVTSTVLSFEYTKKPAEETVAYIHVLKFISSNSFSLQSGSSSQQSSFKYQLNLLDTPGHQDFSEDTYRTLAAADNCVVRTFLFVLSGLNNLAWCSWIDAHRCCQGNRRSNEEAFWSLPDAETAHFHFYKQDGPAISRAVRNNRSGISWQLIIEMILSDLFSTYSISTKLEKEFNLECCPMNWPIGDGEQFKVHINVTI